MKYINKIALFFTLFLFCACSSNEDKGAVKRDSFSKIIDLGYTPSADTYATGWFVDQGAWMGFTPAKQSDWINGICGPYSLDSRRWLAKAAVTISSDSDLAWVSDSVNYYPGALFISSKSDKGKVSQRMIFADASTALIELVADKTVGKLELSGEGWMQGSTFSKDQNRIIVTHPNGEITTLCFGPEVELTLQEDNYTAITQNNKFYIALSYFSNKKEKIAGIQKASNYLAEAERHYIENEKRWESYLDVILRDDMPIEYDRVAVKSLVTLLSNWKVNRGGLLHEGMVPSHAVGYFMGFWAWDTWKFAVPLASVTPELSKNMIRSMFDYQQEDGMIIDCIYVDSSENNARDSKPPLAAWAVNEVFEATRDTAFLKEMYPQLLKYHRWWYEKRDHDQNGICEFGSTDGTIVAAAWESGMDNAIRFDNAKMVKNSDDAWSFDQESIDLNGFLAYEYTLLEKFATVLDLPFEEDDKTKDVANYFYDEETGFFYDRRIDDGSFIKEPGCEAYIPFWAGIATQEQMDRALVYFKDTNMFSTYIPFPTVAADNPKYMPNGYWRGPIWLDQTYFAIKGLRNYNYSELADRYTDQVFQRLDGLIGDAPIHENYDSHTGGRLKAPHFSWSAAHLLMMYSEYGK